jgi:hypothetical protein
MERFPILWAESQLRILLQKKWQYFTRLWKHRRSSRPTAVRNLIGVWHFIYWFLFRSVSYLFFLAFYCLFMSYSMISIFQDFFPPSFSLFSISHDMLFLYVLLWKIYREAESLWWSVPAKWKMITGKTNILNRLLRGSLLLHVHYLVGKILA